MKKQMNLYYILILATIAITLVNDLFMFDFVFYKDLSIFVVFVIKFAIYIDYLLFLTIIYP